MPGILPLGCSEVMDKSSQEPQSIGSKYQLDPWNGNMSSGALPSTRLMVMFHKTHLCQMSFVRTRIGPTGQMFSVLS